MAEEKPGSRGLVGTGGGHGSIGTEAILIRTGGGTGVGATCGGGGLAMAYGTRALALGFELPLRAGMDVGRLSTFGSW